MPFRLFLSVLNQRAASARAHAVTSSAVTADVLNHSDDPDATFTVPPSPSPEVRDLVGRPRQRPPVPHRAGPRDLDGLKRLGNCPASNTSMVDTRLDRTRGRDDSFDPLGRGPAADALRVVLDAPIAPFPSRPNPPFPSFDPTARPSLRGSSRVDPGRCRDHERDPRDGPTTSRDKRNSSSQGWPLRTRDTHTRAARARQRRRHVVTDYPTNRVHCNRGQTSTSSLVNSMSWDTDGRGAPYQPASLVHGSARIRRATRSL